MKTNPINLTRLGRSGPLIARPPEAPPAAAAMPTHWRDGLLPVRVLLRSLPPTSFPSCTWERTYDAGKIQEIDTPKDRTITIKYNGPDPVEADLDNQPLLQVEQNTATGVPDAITIAGQKISIYQAPRPRISTILGKTLLTLNRACSDSSWTFNFTTYALVDININGSATATLSINGDPSTVQATLSGISSAYGNLSITGGGSGASVLIEGNSSVTLTATLNGSGIEWTLSDELHLQAFPFRAMPNQK